MHEPISIIAYIDRCIAYAELTHIVHSAAGARADDGGAIEFSPPTARRAGPVPVDGVVRAEKEKKNCPSVRVPSLVDACRSAPGLPACAAECIVYHYHGGYCDMSPNGRPGDC